MSVLRVGTIQNTSGVQQYLAQAWASFNGSTGVIRGSGNVSSVTRNGAGDYTIGFINAMPDANYAALATGSAGGVLNNSSQSVIGGISSQTTTAVRIFATPDGPNYINSDKDPTNFVVFR